MKETQYSPNTSSVLKESYNSHRFLSGLVPSIIYLTMAVFVNTSLGGKYNFPSSSMKLLLTMKIQDPFPGGVFGLDITRKDIFSLSNS